MFLLRNHFSSFTFLLCLGNQINAVCLDWVLFWLLCREDSSSHNGRNPSKWEVAVFLTSLPDSSRNHISSPLICPLFPFPFSDCNYPLPNKHPIILLLLSAIYKEQPGAFILINIYFRLKQKTWSKQTEARNSPVKLSGERLICVLFSCRSCSPLFLWKMLTSHKLENSVSPATLLGDHWKHSWQMDTCDQDARDYQGLRAAAHPGPCRN